MVKKESGGQKTEDKPKNITKGKLVRLECAKPLQRKENGGALRDRSAGKSSLLGVFKNPIGKT